MDQRRKGSDQLCRSTSDSTFTKPGVVPKLDEPRTGPFEITKVHNNGTAEIQKSPSVTKLVNIRRLTPYFESTEPLGSG